MTAQRNDNPVGTVITAIRTAKTATDNASARLVDAIYTHCEATFDADSVRKFFNGESDYRSKVAASFFEAHDQTYVREVATLEKELDKVASERNKVLVAETRQRHNYLRQQFIDALTAVYALRCGFVFGAEEERINYEVVDAKLNSNGRFKVVVLMDGERTVYDGNMTCRQLRQLGKEAMKARKVGPANAAGKTDTQRSGLSTLSPAKAIEAMSVAFKGNVKSLLEAQAKEDNTDSVSVADLADDVENTIYALAEDVIKSIFTGTDGVVDMDYFEEWCHKRAIKTVHHSTRKRSA